MAPYDVAGHGEVMAWTYILECCDDSYYVGSTIDLERRVGQHQAGEGAKYTRHRRPVRLVWAAQFSSIRAAFEFEKQVQGWGRRKREALIAGHYDLLPRMASRCWSAQQEAETARPIDASRVTATMPWDVPHERIDDPDDPWAPLVPLDVEDAPLPYTRIVPETWSRDGC